MAEVISMYGCGKLDPHVRLAICDIPVAVDQESVEPVIATLRHLDCGNGFGGRFDSDGCAEVAVIEVILITILNHERPDCCCNHDVGEVAAPRMGRCRRPIPAFGH